MPKPKKPLKPFKSALWNEEKRRWEGRPYKPVKGGALDGMKPREYIGESNWVPVPQNGNCSSKFGQLVTRIHRPKKKKALTAVQKRKIIYEKLKPVWRSQPTNHYCSAHCKGHNLFTPAENYPHHKKGRVGDLLNDVRYWMPICYNCHRWIHDHVDASYQLGWLIKSGSTTH